MSVQLRNLLHSLGVRLLVPLFLTVGVVLTVYAWFSFQSTQQHFLQLVRTDVRRSSDLIGRATHDGMLLNRLEDVQAIIERLAEGGDVAAIRVYDKQGSIVLSADKGEIGHRAALADAVCTSCHGENGPATTDIADAGRMSRLSMGEEVVRNLSVIPNEPACAAVGCHASPAQKSTLGVLEVEMSMQPLQSTLRSARQQLIGTTVALLLIIGLVSAVFIRRFVHRPIFQLAQATRRIASGDLSARIDVRGRHELARLAEAFNTMADDLSLAQKELTDWSQKLEAKVLEKTEELRRAQRQVLHMEKMASLGTLSATVAHELNNPISAVLTYARLVSRELKEQPLKAEVREELERYLSLMGKECSRCGEIVQNLLLFARRTGAQMAPVDLNEIVNRSLMLVRHHLEIKGIQLKSELLSGDSQIVADAGLLQQALVALLINAVEAMEEHDPANQLSVRLSGDAQEVRINISDTGVGIPPDMVSQIFEPFFSTKEKESGVGLGLAVVYGIVHQHAGTIEVDSEVGRGTTFKLRLPRQPAPKDQAEKEALPLLGRTRAVV